MKKSSFLLPMFVLLLLAFAISVSAATTDTLYDGNTVSDTDCATGYVFCDVFDGTAVDWTTNWMSSQQSLYSVADSRLTADSPFPGTGQENNFLSSQTEVMSSTTDYTMLIKFNSPSLTADGFYIYSGENPTTFGGEAYWIFPNTEIKVFTNSTGITSSAVNYSVLYEVDLATNSTTYEIFDNDGVSLFGSTAIDADLSDDDDYFQFLNWKNGAGTDLLLEHVLIWEGTAEDAPYLPDPLNFSNSSYTPTNPIEGFDVNFSIIATNPDGVDRYKFSYYNQSAAAWQNITSFGEPTSTLSKTDSNLQLFLPLNETSYGTLYDYSNNGYSLPISSAGGGTSYTCTDYTTLNESNGGLAGKFGLLEECIQESGTWATANVLHNNSYWTYAGFIYINETTQTELATNGDQYAYQIWTGEGSGCGRMSYNLVSSNGSLMSYIAGSCSNYYASEPVPLNEWVLSATTNDGVRELIYYIDRSGNVNLVGNFTSGAYDITTATYFSFGHSVVTSNPSMKKAAYVTIWDTPLSEADLIELATNGLDGELSPGIVDYFTPTQLGNSSNYLLNMTRTMPIEETVYNWTWYARDSNDLSYYQSQLYSLEITPASNITVSNYVTPYNPGTNAYLTCNYNFSHAESETMDINLTWFKNGTHQPSYDYVFSSGNLTGQTDIGQGTVTEDLTETDSWTCSVYVQKGSDDNTATDTVQIGGYVTPEMTFGDFVNGSINSTNIMIDLTCADNHYLWFDSVNPPTTLVLNDTATDFYNTSSFSTVNGTYYFYGACVNATTGAPEYKTEVQYWTLDNFFPRIAIPDSNAFNQQGYALDNQYDNVLPLNFTIVENRDLFAFLINITLNGVEYYSYQNESLSGTTFNYTNQLDVTAYPRGVTYDINIQSTDSHTNNKICPFDDDNCYNPKKKSSEIEFDTAEGINIRVVTKDTSTVDYEKLQDRYTFDFDFADGKEKLRKIDLYSDKPLIYRPLSEEPGHFVIVGEGISGNWIDFAGDGILKSDVTVKRITDYHYELTFKKLKANQKFKSIGGLNLMDLTFTYYMGEYFTSSPDSLERLPTYLSINVTYDNNTQSDIGATLNYPVNISSTQTKTIGDGYIHFLETFDAYTETRGVANLTEFNWTIVPLQQDGNYTSFDQPLNHTNYGWDMDDCSTYNTSLFNYSALNEKTGLNINFNSSFVHEFWVDENPTLTRNYDIIKTDSATTYNFCRFPDFVNITGDTNHIVSSSGYESKDYRIFGDPFEGAIDIFLLATEISNAYITYIITDGSLAKIENAIMKFYRNINNVQTLIYTGTTDFAGSVTLYQDQQNTYDITINATGYPFKSFFLRPISTLYTIQLDEQSTPFYNDPYDGIRYKVSPVPYIWNRSNDMSAIIFEIEGTDLEYAGVEFTKYSSNMVCIPASCRNETTSPTGGTMTIYFNSSQDEYFLTSLYFKTLTGQKIYINQEPSRLSVIEEFGSNLYNIFKDLSDNSSHNVRAIVVGLTMFAAVAFLAQLGIIGMFAAPVVIVILWFFALVGCRDLGQTVVSAASGGLYTCDYYFVHPTIAIITTIVLIGAYIWFMEKRQ